MAIQQKITANLWFDGQAEAAVQFYTGIFKNASIGRVTRYGKEGFEFHGKPEGTAMTIQFYLEGQEFVALNGGPQFKFTEALSFIVNCDSQEEIDYYWEKLSEKGDPAAQVCGWLKDQYGLSWQIVPTLLVDLMTSAEGAKAQKVMHALMGMKKINSKELQDAFDS